MYLFCSPLPWQQSKPQPPLLALLAFISYSVTCCWRKYCIPSSPSSHPTASSVEYLVDQEATREDGVRIATIFSFTSNTPNLIVSDSNQLNREERDQYRFNVIVSNEEGSDTAEVNVVLYLTDANDNDPNITNSGYAGTATAYIECKRRHWCCKKRQTVVA